MNEQYKELTPELKQKLQAAGKLGFDAKVTPFRFVDSYYLDEKNGIPRSLWPRWTLLSKDALQLAEAEDNAGEMKYDDKTEAVTTKLKSGSQRLETLRYGIKKVKGFPSKDGDKVVFIDYDKDKLQMNIVDEEGHNKAVANCRVDELIRRIPIDDQRRLQNAVNERKEPNPEEIEGLEF